MLERPFDVDDSLTQGKRRLLHGRTASVAEMRAGDANRVETRQMLRGIRVESELCGKIEGDRQAGLPCRQ